MTTLPQSSTLFRIRMKIAEFTHRTNNKKKNPDWSRIEEPDTFLQPFILFFYALLITVAAGMINYAFAAPGSLELAIARFLIPYMQAGQPFYQVYAVFTFAVTAIIESLVFTFIAVTGEPDHHGLVGMISQLDSNTQDRIADLDKTIIDRLYQISKDISDFTPL